ncbi:SLC13 family permease [Streptomyces endophyticus]|uniref:SLC13 family permease n=1 Tax=Streptomyces endophyticus TaxID=714166 RepID=A0ABU6F9H2_9ACTN|nr:SLC13 family permease [Streptomyces endophyticus]MEB8340690.1 SLC13 family permease [Streptomyces endophyticus]
MIHVLAIALLVVAFVLTTTLGINLGALALVCTLVVGVMAAGFPAEKLVAEFPGDVFVILVGTTYLFTIARRNGTLDFLINWLVGRVGARPGVVLWIMFVLTGGLAALGSVFAVAMIAPVALALAARYRVSSTVMGLLVVHGWGAGVLSPISVFGVIVNSVLGQAGITGSPMRVFMVGAIANTLAALAVFVVWLARRPLRTAGPQASTDAATATGSGPPASAPPVTPEDSHTPASAPLVTPEDSRTPTGTLLTKQSRTATASRRDRFGYVATLAALLALVVAVVGFGAHIGLAALACAFVLALLQPEVSRSALREVPWDVVLLVCGVFTYIALLQRIGTIDAAADLITSSSTPTIAVLIACYVGAVVSAFASSTGIISAIVPLILPVLAVSDLSAATVAAALAVAMTIVDVSPLSTNGALLVANASPDDRDRLFRRLLGYGLSMAAVAPLLLWAAVVVAPA